MAKFGGGGGGVGGRRLHHYVYVYVHINQLFFLMLINSFVYFILEFFT